MNAVLTRTLPHARSVPALTAVVTLASAAAVLAGPAPLAVPGGLLLGLVLPGLALNALIFRYRTLSAVERTVLAPALSLAVLIISGLILYVAGFPLDRTSWTLAATAVTLAVLGLKAVPERIWPGENPAPAEERTQIRPRVRPGPFAPRPAGQQVPRGRLARQLTPMVLVVAILAGAGYLSFVSSQRSYEVTVTALSAAPPGPADTTGARTVEISASGLVAADGPYTVRVTGPDGTWLAERTVPAGGSGSWRSRLRLPAAQRLTVALFRAGDTIAYRTLYLAAATE